MRSPRPCNRWRNDTRCWRRERHRHVLTYREAAISHVSTAEFMADHLRERTLPEEARQLAAYYQQDTGVADYEGTVPRVRADLSPAMARVLGLDSRGPPTRTELVNLLAGYRTDGAKLPGVRRYTRYHNRASIAYLDFTFSADKSVSLAWAFAATEAERAIIARAHRDAVHAAMAHVTTTLGVTRRRGEGGEIVSIPGEIGWVEFDHYTARPTAKIATTEPDGAPTTVLQTVMVSGAPQLHTHVVIPNVVRTLGGAGRLSSFGMPFRALTDDFCRQT
jgi:hypothetical protein